MTRDPSIYLADILDSISIIEEYCEGLSLESFLASRKDQDAVIRRLLIIGEAAARLPDEFKTSHPDIPWREIVGMRNFLVHDCSRVNLNLVWETIQTQLPALKAKLTSLV